MISKLFENDIEDILIIKLLKKRRRDRENNLELPKIEKSGSFFRKRWDEEYLVRLAEQERSFVSEYRVCPRGFQLLIELLGPDLVIDTEMARRSMAISGSKPITTGSRVASALILLAGGRPVEVMRTHGISMSQVARNFAKVVAAINRHPSLAIKCD